MSACLAPPARAAAIADSFDIPDFIAASTISRALSLDEEFIAVLITLTLSGEILKAVFTMLDAPRLPGVQSCREPEAAVENIARIVLALPLKV